MSTIVNQSQLSPPVVSRRGRRKKKQRHKSRMITGYIIYASEIRKEVIKKCPDRDFGYISKIVGLEWKNLSIETKMSYEKRAQEQNEKTRAIIQQLALAPPPPSISPAPVTPSLLTPTSSTSSGTNAQHCCQQQQHQLTLPPLAYHNNYLQQQQQLTPAPPTLICHNAIQSQQQPLQFMSTNIVYRKPATIKLRPRDIGTQTEPIEWKESPPVKKPLRFSQTFINYLNSYKSTTTMDSLTEQV